jgi:hypothetical protein
MTKVKETLKGDREMHRRRTKAISDKGGIENNTRASGTIQ